MALVAAKANVVAKKEVRTSFLFRESPGGGAPYDPIVGQSQSSFWLCLGANMVLGKFGRCLILVGFANTSNHIR